MAVLSLERPKRPLTAYNYFFHDERQKLLATLPVRATGKPKPGTHGKIGFGALAKIVSTKWKAITAEQMIHYAGLANIDKMRYQEQMRVYKQKLRLVKEQQHEEATITRTTSPIDDPAKDVLAYSSYGDDEEAMNRLLQYLEPVHMRAPVMNCMENDYNHYYQQQQQPRYHSYSLIEPVPIRSNNNNHDDSYNSSSIAELARKLDKESIEFLLRALK